MPAHWLLARLGKKVMRPGGSALSDVLLSGLAIGPGDDVVDLAPALGDTVRRVELAGPATLRGVERGRAEAERARQLGAGRYECVVAEPEATGLPDGSASVVYGEACLSLETDDTKERILAEAARLLRPGGRLGLHELLLTPDDIAADDKHRIETDLTRTVRIRARPLTRAEWTTLLEKAGSSSARSRRHRCSCSRPVPSSGTKAGPARCASWAASSASRSWCAGSPTCGRPSTGNAGTWGRWSSSPHARKAEVIPRDRSMHPTFGLQPEFKSRRLFR
jgi:hypothetical protein